MKTCVNHPNRRTFSICHSCGKDYCEQCLNEGKEYYYCESEICQVELKKELELHETGTIKKTKKWKYFQGKIGRGNFLLRMFIYVFILVVASIIMKGSFAFLGLLLVFIALALYFNAIGLRLNDLNKSWTYFLLIFVPFANLYLLYLLFLKEGEKI